MKQKVLKLSFESLQWQRNEVLDELDKMGEGFRRANYISSNGKEGEKSRQWNGNH
jgi:hypothetical protein